MRETTSIRLSERERELVDRAAILLGQKPNEFVRYAAVQEAVTVIKDMQGVVDA